ncbi:MAG: GDSL-type esterase/lipase family protein, partial [Bacteroidota bacterium]
MNYLFCLFIFSFFSLTNINAQDPLRFKAEIDNIKSLEYNGDSDAIVFTGSSSIRFWTDLSDDCTGGEVINTGFGGSQMSDLMYYLDEAVLKFQPKKVYIYEGDNDINAEKEPADILTTAKQVVDKILAADKKIQIVFISAKPSPSRWNYRDQYVAFN